MSKAKLDAGAHTTQFKINCHFLSYQRDGAPDLQITPKMLNFCAQNSKTIPVLLQTHYLICKVGFQLQKISVRSQKSYLRSPKVA